MSSSCDHFRNQIPRAMFADLDPAEQQSLERHLSECAPCSREKELYAQTFGKMRSLENVPAPRHFLVYPEERRKNPWQLFRDLPLAWQASLSAASLILLVFSGISAARLQVKVEDGAYIFAFGRPAPVRTVAAPAPVLDTAALEDRILRIVEEKNRKEGLEWVRTLRTELAQSQQKITRNQRAMLETALANLETRMSMRLDDTARVLDDRRSQSLATLYQAMKLQRASDLALVDGRFNRLAISGEKKNSETDAILETLLQVAELNTR